MLLNATDYLNDIKHSIANADYSLASRRILDFVYDYNLNLNEPLKLLSFKIRTEYLTASLQTNATINVDLYKQWLLQITTINVNENTINVKDFEIYTAQNLSKEFKSKSRNFKLQPLALTLKLGELTAVVGENGNGKTTLLRLIAGELAATTGAVTYFKKPLTNWYELKNKIAYIPQRPNKWYGTLIDNLHFYCSINGIYNDVNQDYVNYILHRLGLFQFKNLKWTEISSGYRLRFELAKALMMRPKLLVLDEPLANLDINAQQLFLQDLKYLAQSSKNPMAIVLSSQQLHELERNCKNIVFIKQGQTIYSGEQQQFASNRQTNAFEVGGNFNLQQLQQHFNALGDVTITDSGTVFIINTNLSVTSMQFLQAIANSNLEVNYFRDISKSTRQLFQKDI